MVVNTIVYLLEIKTNNIFQNKNNGVRERSRTFILFSVFFILFLILFLMIFLREATAKNHHKKVQCPFVGGIALLAIIDSKKGGLEIPADNAGSKSSMRKWENFEKDTNLNYAAGDHFVLECWPPGAEIEKSHAVYVPIPSTTHNCVTTHIETPISDTYCY